MGLSTLHDFLPGDELWLGGWSMWGVRFQKCWGVSFWGWNITWSSSVISRFSICKIFAKQSSACGELVSVSALSCMMHHLLINTPHAHEKTAQVQFFVWVVKGENKVNPCLFIVCSCCVHLLFFIFPCLTLNDYYWWLRIDALFVFSSLCSAFSSAWLNPPSDIVQYKSAEYKLYVTCNKHIEDTCWFI